MSIMTGYRRVNHVTGKDKYFTYQVVESVLCTKTGQPVSDVLMRSWKGCILDSEGKVIKSSRRGSPMIGSSFGKSGHCTLVTIPCRYLDTAEEIRSYMYEEMDKQEKETELQQIGSSVWFGKTKKIQGRQVDFFWFEESSKIPKVQTETQRLAQQQVSLNATKIAKLEEELKQLRITQKLLKGLR